ncbi:hypothetical protein GQ44DRAFT_702049 [Phaeosphaeriaceae sp. PMI808]|nr:hypothetical protein GQ44DRAFT_702049 [Phaeosphaeriaceae sp. PMI808]
MTRVHHTRPQGVAHRGITLDQPRAAVKKKKPYKIVLEAVTQEKKKLHSILTYASNAPKGFGFIPAGHPEFTEWCKEQCRQRNLDVHIVSAKPKNKMHADPEKLSHHVHRVGAHFPIEIVNLACSKFGYVYDEAEGLHKDKSRDRTNWIAQGVEAYSSRQLLQGGPSTEKETKEHTRGAVREMFPKIPEADLDSIVNHAFEEGTNRVGNAKELSLARRVQLAVVAHIRHMYTDYDKMLKTGSWMSARQKVEHVSLAKLKEWRDETGEQSDEIEDTFREVIILDDDEDSSDEGSGSTPDEREQSMEIVSSRATERDLQPERHVRADPYAMRRVPRRTILVQPYASPHSAPLHRQPVSHSSPIRTPRHIQGSNSRQAIRSDSSSVAHSIRIGPRVRPTAAHPASRALQHLMQEIDGQMYHLEPIREPHGPERLHHEHPPPREPPPRAAPRHTQGRISDQDVVLPSVEHEIGGPNSPLRMANIQQETSHPRPPPREYLDLQLPKRKSLPSFPDHRDSYIGQDIKRLKPIYNEDGFAPRAVPAQGLRPSYANNYQPTDIRNRPRAPPHQEVIDLTSSPRRPPPNTDDGYYQPGRFHAVPGPSGLSNTPVTRQSGQREVRRAHHEVYPSEPPHTYNPNGGVYERRAPPPRDYIPMQGEQPRRPVDRENARYLRSAVHHGGPHLH